MHRIFACLFAAALLCIAAAPRAAPPDVDFTPIPATLIGIWSLIDQKNSELGDIVRARDMDHVHHRAFSIRDLANALLGRTGRCASAPLQRLKDEAASVARLAEDLDRASDAGDGSALDAAYAKLQDELKALRTDFPGGCTQGTM